MKTELHLHTRRYSGCAVATAAELLERMVQIGYEAVFLTEHDAVWSDWEIEQVQLGFPQIRILPGLELSIGPEPVKHLLILGTNDPEYVRMHADPAAALAKARDAGHLTVLAHPFRWEGGREFLESGCVPDALELRTNGHGPAEAALSELAAEEYGLPLLNAGDTHDLHMLNRFWIETDAPLRGPLDVRKTVLNRGYVNCLDPDA
jgi:hypothetical protein